MQNCPIDYDQNRRRKGPTHCATREGYRQPGTDTEPRHALQPEYGRKGVDSHDVCARVTRGLMLEP